MPRPTTRLATGFTLVELLVVIAIITILAAILVPTIAKTSETAKIKGTLGLLRGLENACALYRAEVGNYPGANIPDGGVMTTYLYRGLTLDADGDGQAEDSEMLGFDGVTRRDPYFVAANEQVEMINNEYRFVDRWGSEIGYDEIEIPKNQKTAVTVRSHRGIDCGDPRKDDESDVWGVRKVNLWSLGPDGRSSPNEGAAGEYNEDNVNNWDA